jgi:hypothetical protein
MVVIEPLQNLVQPSANLTHPAMKTPTQLLLDLGKLGMHPLGHRHAPQLEPATAACDATDMRKAQKIKRLRPALPLAATPRVGITAEGDQSGLLGMK